MARDTEEYQPGRLLYGVLVGALRMRGTTFNGWCKENGIGTPTARAAAYGLSQTDASRKILEDMIEFAGRDFVRDAYRRRMAEHVEAINGSKHPSAPAGKVARHG